MAAPTLGLLNSTSIDTAESVTGWTKFDLLDTDIKKEGNNGITGTFRADATIGHFDNGSAPVTASGKTFRMWINTTNVPYLDTLANGGCELLMYDGTTTEYITVFSSEDYFGGWFQVVIDPALFTTLTLANIQRWGIRLQLHTSAKNVDNVWVDALKYLDGYSILGGTSGDEVTFATIEVADRGTTTLYGYGIIGVVSGVYYCTGKIQFGTGATTMWFLADGEILIFEDKPIATGLYELSGIGTGSRVTIQNSVIKSSGTTDATRFIVDMSDSNLLSCTFASNLVVRAGAVTFKSGQTCTDNTFDDCGVITAGGADFSGTIIKGYEGTTDTGAFLWNVATNPNIYTDGMAFVKGTAATHAIQFGTSAPQTMTLTDIAFGTGWGATDSTSATLLVPDTGSDVTWNISLVGCTGTITVSQKRVGDTVNLIIDPVTTTITVKDVQSLGVIEDARVVLLASSSAGDLPFEGSITTITAAQAATTGATTLSADGTLQKFTRGSGSFLTDTFEAGMYVTSSGFTNAENNGRWLITSVDATNMVVVDPSRSDVLITETGGGDEQILAWECTVTQTGHGLVVGDVVEIAGSTTEGYNGIWEVASSSDANTYTYYPIMTVLTSPAVGTKIATGGYFNELTNASGVVTDSRSLTSSQPMTGKVRKSTTSPLYKTAPINETVSSSGGLAVTVYMIPDE